MFVNMQEGNINGNLAVKYVEDYTIAHVKIEFPPAKHFLKASEEDELLGMNKYASSIERVLRHSRVERRCSRAKGTLLNTQDLIKITKAVGPLIGNMGYQDKTGKYLMPEEALYLIELNKLEVDYNNAPLSIQEAYDIFLKHIPLGLNQYKVYRELVLLGYRVSRKKGRHKVEEKVLGDINPQVPPDCLKRKKDDTGDDKSKKMKIDESDFIKIFDELRKRAPKQREEEQIMIPHYFVFLPKNSSKIKADFNLYISDTYDFCNLGNFEGVPNVFALCNDNNVSFYRFSNVVLPFLYDFECIKNR